MRKRAFFLLDVRGQMSVLGVAGHSLGALRMELEWIEKEVDGTGWVTVHSMYSLVPRPFPPPVFDRLQYANMKGEGLGDLVTCGYIR